VLSESFVEVDELHEFLKIDGAVEKILKSKHVFALSATLGDRIGKERLNEKLGECKILNTTEQLSKSGMVNVTFERVPK
jgi:hypothetical protein